MVTSVDIFRLPVRFGKYVVDLGSRTLRLNLFFALVLALVQLPELRELLQSFGGPVYAFFERFAELVIIVANIYMRLKTTRPALGVSGKA